MYKSYSKILRGVYGNSTGTDPFSQPLLEAFSWVSICSRTRVPMTYSTP